MGPKTVLSCRQGKSGLHRPTLPKHTLKLAARLLIAVTEDNPRAKPAAKRKSARTKEVAYERLAENRGWRTPREVFTARLSHSLKAASGRMLFDINLP